MDRTKSKSRLVYNTSLGVMGLFLRRLFLQNLGAELSGLSGLFQNLIEFLNLATAGFAAAIYPRLYQCNARNDYSEINKLMQTMKQFYYIVAGFVCFAGIICSFFVDKMIYENQYSLLFLREVFLIQVLTQCIRIIASPNVALLSAREQGYYNIFFDIVMNIAVYVLQIIAVVNARSYILYLFIALAGYFFYVISLEITIKKIYPWLEINIFGRFKLPRQLHESIKYTVIMQLATFIFFSTDSAVISNSIGLVQVNAYNNYMTIATAVLGLYSSFDNAVRNYFGNKLAIDKSKEAKLRFVRTVSYVYYFIGVLCTVEYICLIRPFIRLWVGEAYVLYMGIGILFGLYIYMRILFNAVAEYLQILGLFKCEMRANITSAIINIALSMILVRKIGIAGVLLGTVTGLLILFIQRVVYVFKDIGAGVLQYIFDMVLYSITLIITLFVSLKVCNIFRLSSLFADLLVKGMLVLLLIGIINIVLYWKKQETTLLYTFFRSFMHK